MSYASNSDNIFPKGTLITAKENPSVQLEIADYYKRIYYCTVVDKPNQKQLVYFEHELIAPAQ